MSERWEKNELMTLCLLEDTNTGRILVQDRLKDDWKGIVLPGGHVEPRESVYKACIREMKEETGLDIYNPRLCGIKQWQAKDARCLVLLFYADEFSGSLCSSEEGKVFWKTRAELKDMNTVRDFDALLDMMEDPGKVEFVYEPDRDKPVVY